MSLYKIPVCQSNFALISLKVISHQLKIKVLIPEFYILPGAFGKTKGGLRLLTPPLEVTTINTYISICRYCLHMVSPGCQEVTLLSAELNFGSDSVSSIPQLSDILHWWPPDRAVIE